MRPVEKWIWLPEAVCPKAQTSRYSWMAPENPEPEYAVAQFTGTYAFGKEVEQVHLRFSGDTAFALFCNGQHLANGPVLPGGDFLALYGNPAETCPAEIAALRADWERRFSRFSVKTPSPEFDTMINTWNAYNCYMTFIWSRAASFTAPQP